MRVIQCDGCGCTYPISEKNIIIHVFHPSANHLETERHYDVCPKCLRYISTWLPPIKKDFLPEEETDVC